MSLIITVARAQRLGAGRMGPSQGDPGLFGDIWGAVKRTARTGAAFVTGGPTAAATTFLRRSAPSAPVGPVPLMGAMPGTGAPPQQNGQVVRTPGFRGFTQRLVPGGQTGFQATGCQSGFHPNKTSYFLKDGSFVDVGTRCVRNRRRNPMNARALSRAIGRVDSGKRLQHRLSQISTGKYTAAGKRKSCPS